MGSILGATFHDSANGWPGSGQEFDLGEGGFLGEGQAVVLELCWVRDREGAGLAGPAEGLVGAVVEEGPGGAVC